MKIKPLYTIVFLIIVGLTGFIVFKYIDYADSKIKYTDANMNIDTLMKDKLEAKKDLDLTKVISFDWDELYVFEAYSDERDILKTVGTKWTTTNSFLWYLVEHYDSGLYNDDRKKMVFVKNKKVICDVNYNIELFDFNEDYYKKENSILKIELGKDKFSSKFKLKRQ